jgi:pilus assembly protein CpaE
MAGERILLVDDDDQVRAALSHHLTLRGFQVKQARDGMQALGTLLESTPQLVISDLTMPYVNGLELGRRLRNNQKTARVPIILLATPQQAQQAAVGVSPSVDEYVPKPVNPAVLVEKVEMLLLRGRAGGSGSGAPRGKVVLFMRGKGGVGATTLAVNVALRLAAPGTLRVGMMDLNLEYGNVALLLGVSPTRTLADLPQVRIMELDDTMFAQYLTLHPSGLRLLAAPDATEKAGLVSVPTVEEALFRLRALVDYVLVDTPAAFTKPLLAALDAAAVIYVITIPHLASLAGTAACLTVLRKLQVPPERIHLVVNHTAPHGLRDDYVARSLGRPPDATIPYTPALYDQASVGRALADVVSIGSPGAVAMQQLAIRTTDLAPIAARR